MWKKKTFYGLASQACGMVPGFMECFKRFERQVVLRGLSEGLLTNYGCNVVQLSLHFGRCPELVSVEEINCYLYHRAVDEHICESYIKHTVLEQDFFINPLNPSPDGRLSCCLKITRLNHKTSHSVKRRESETKTKHQQPKKHEKPLRKTEKKLLKKWPSKDQHEKQANYGILIDTGTLPMLQFNGGLNATLDAFKP